MNTDKIIASLRSHFDSVTVNPPATVELLENARATFPEVPDELTEFWRQCDGIQVGLEDGVVGEIFGIQYAIKSYNIWFHDNADIASFIPLRSDACGNYDCVVGQHQLASHSVVFWDHEVYSQPSHLLGGTLMSYLSFWSRHLANCFFPDGQMNPQFYPWAGKARLRDPWPFDEEWLRNNDPRAEALLSQDTVRQWLAGQDNLRC